MFITPYLSQQPVNDFSLRSSNSQFSVLLAANTDTTVTIPGDAPRYKALIKAKNDTWIAINAVAAAPAGATFASTTSELILGGNEICREVKAGDILHFLSTTASTVVGISLFSVGMSN